MTSALSDGALTLADWAKRLDPDGKTATVVELLEQSNEILDDMLWMEANEPTGHLTTVRTGLPSVYWRMINQGIAPSKSVTKQVSEAIGMLEAYSEVDVALAKMNGNVNAFRLSEAMVFIEAMNQEFVQTLFYGAATSPEEFVGLSARYSDLSANVGENILSAGGSSSDNSSIWLCGWSENKFTGIFPKGSMAGLEHEDLGIETVEVSAGVAGNRMRAYREHYVWKGGIALKDWRYVVRIPNIDISNLVGKSSAADLYDLMIKAYHRIPNIGSCKPVYYMNRSCFEMLDIQGRDDTIAGGGIKAENVEGKVKYSFRGVPVRIVDQLTEAESVVS